MLLASNLIRYPPCRFPRKAMNPSICSMTTYTMSEARANLGEVVRKARYGNEIVELTEHGRPPW